MFIEAKEAVLLLPAKTRYEQDDGGTETSTERRVMFTPEIPAPGRRSARRMEDPARARGGSLPGARASARMRDGWEMREEIARVVPMYEGVQHLRKTGDAFQYGGPRLCDDGVFPTPDGKAHFRAVELPG
jgi:predicted molibdopterin-dependent oxidoreductase YjgC